MVTVGWTARCGEMLGCGDDAGWKHSDGEDDRGEVERTPTTKVDQDEERRRFEEAKARETTAGENPGFT